MSSPSAPARIDIQALRGLAVLLVVAYHAWGLPVAGFLGVDIFFVVSGFLITGLVVRAIDEGRFSARELYLRRARRLLPAAYVVLIACCLAAPWLLTHAELKAFWSQVVGAVAFSANLVLWRQGGYFAGGMELKPLLHFWSLAIEEQYYLLMPAALVLAPRRWWKPGLAVGLVASLGLAVYGAANHPNATPGGCCATGTSARVASGSTSPRATT